MRVGKSNARDVLFSLALSRSALLSEKAVCPTAFLGHSTGDCSPYLRARESALALVTLA